MKKAIVVIVATSAALVTTLGIANARSTKDDPLTKDDGNVVVLSTKDGGHELSNKDGGHIEAKLSAKDAGQIEAKDGGHVELSAKDAGHTL